MAGILSPEQTADLERARHAYTIRAFDGIARYLPDNWLLRPDLPPRGFAGG